MIRRRLLALTACLTVLGACTSSRDELVASDEPLVLPDESAASEETARAKPALLPEGVDMLAVPVTRYVTVWDRPIATRPAFELDTRNPAGKLSPMLIDDAKRRSGTAWYEVFLPLRPNGATGWVRLEDVQLRRSFERIEVDLSDRMLRHYVDDDLRHRFSVGVGTDTTPTGRGTFYVWVKILYSSPYQPYGIAALGLSGFSPVLTDWPGGGRMAIHGTSSPSDQGREVSHGCVRVYNEDLKALLDVPLGTPVLISS